LPAKENKYTQLSAKQDLKNSILGLLTKGTAFYAFISLIAVLIVSCANPQAPEGGPRDATPPVILEFSPQQNTLNFSGESIVINFDDYMNRSSVIKNLYITPEIKTEYDWSGKEFEIEFIEPLESNTTYAITLDGGYTDRFGNNPETPFTLIFSTGNDLDSASISGKVQGKSETLFAMLWRPDSTGSFPDVTQTKADYRLKVSNKGTFSFKGLKEGKYRIAAVDDKFQDGIVDFNSDGFSAYKKDIEVLEGQKVSGIEMFAGPAVDTSAPGLVSAYYRNPVSFSVRLSEIINPDNLDPTSLNVTDSLGDQLLLTGLGVDTTDKDLLVAFTEPMIENMLYDVLLVNTSSGISDSTGNTAWPYVDTLSFGTPEEFEDYDIPIINLVDINVTDSMRGFDYRDTLVLEFDYALDGDLIQKSVSLIDAGKAVRPGQVKSRSDSTNIDTVPILKPIDIELQKLRTGRYAIIAPLEPQRKYMLSIDSSFLKIPFAERQFFADSTDLDFLFTTGYKPDFSEVSGEIIVEAECEGEIILIAYREKEEVLRWELNRSQKFGPLLLESGNYTFKAFCDRNNNHQRDYGYPSPYAFAETEYFIGSKLSVKPRWDITDFIINIKPSGEEVPEPIRPVIPLEDE
jgi:hypothetical protein